jgi:hypothetical protein
MHLEKPIPNKCRVLIYCRFSTDEQRAQSIAAQRLFCERFLRSHGFVDGVITVISDEGLSGELRNRPGIDEVRRLIESRSFDLLIVEDSSRLYRNIGYCLDLVGTAVDLKVRVICINDDVETWRKDWRKRLTEAQQHHTQANDCTRDRLSRTLEELWFSGSAIGLARPGYRRIARILGDPRSPKVDEVDPQWRPVIIEAFKMVAAKNSLESVAKFLTGQKLPKFANAQSAEWNDRNILSLVRCELYRGIEIYREQVSEKQNRSGRSKPVQNPDPQQILQRDMSHLRMVEDWLWFQANEAINERARPGSNLSGFDHPLHGIPRDSRTLLSNIFVCDICKNKMYATGRNEGGYRCSAAGAGKCWNKATCLRDLTHERIATTISNAILEITPGVIDVLVGHIESLLTNHDRLHDERQKLTKRRDELERNQQRFLKVIREQDSPPEFITAELVRLDAELMRLRVDEQLLDTQLTERTALPNREQIMVRLQEMATTVRIDNQESRVLLRQLIDGPIRAVPFQPLGNSNVVLRAELTLKLVRLFPDQVSLMLNGRQDVIIEQGVFQKPLSLDLFVLSKPQEYAMRALNTSRENLNSILTLEQLGRKLGLSKRTAHLALQLGKHMESVGIIDPFIRLSECPPNPARWKFKDAG